MLTYRDFVEEWVRAAYLQALGAVNQKFVVIAEGNSRTNRGRNFRIRIDMGCVGGGQKANG